MAKEICPNCNFKMARPVSFCPECSRPTRHATPDELVEWDLRQWRRHVDRSVAAGISAPTAVNLTSVAVADQPAPQAVTPRRPVTVERPKPVVRQTSPQRPPERPVEGIEKPARVSLRTKLRGRVSTFRRAEPDRVIVLDSDDPFHYTACTSCERNDWIVRTTRNEDGTYNYWCVRCSRSFKTDARINQALKPFAAAGSVIGLLATLSVVMR